MGSFFYGLMRAGSTPIARMAQCLRNRTSVNPECDSIGRLALSRVGWRRACRNVALVNHRSVAESMRVLASETETAEQQEQDSEPASETQQQQEQQDGRRAATVQQVSAEQQQRGRRGRSVFGLAMARDQALTSQRTEGRANQQLASNP